MSRDNIFIVCSVLAGLALLLSICSGLWVIGWYLATGSWYTSAVHTAILYSGAAFVIVGGCAVMLMPKE